MATIVILEHRLQGKLGLPYMAYALAERWARAGHRILVHRGLEAPPPGALAINNIEPTVTPPAYRALFERYPRVVNGWVIDISKSRFSQDIIGRDSDWRGPVIVKTEANFGGKPEQLLRAAAGQAIEADDIPAGPVAEGYPTYTTAAEVPEAAWTTPGLIVERFLPERDERGYYLRVWTFFGDRERSSRYRCAAPIVKSHNVLEREEVPVPAAMRAWREKLGFDFGKFDYVLSGGRYVLLDVNRTPSLPASLPPEVAAGMDALAPGLAAFLT